MVATQNGKVSTGKPSGTKTLASPKETIADHIAAAIEMSTDLIENRWTIAPTTSAVKTTL